MKTRKIANGLFFMPGGTVDIASAICWPLSPKQRWVTGQVLHVDGGMSTVQAR